jgi:hypothetical protein
MCRLLPTWPALSNPPHRPRPIPILPSPRFIYLPPRKPFPSPLLLLLSILKSPPMPKTNPPLAIPLSPAIAHTVLQRPRLTGLTFTHPPTPDPLPSLSLFLTAPPLQLQTFTPALPSSPEPSLLPAHPSSTSTPLTLDTSSLTFSSPETNFFSTPAGESPSSQPAIRLNPRAISSSPSALRVADRHEGGASAASLGLSGISFGLQGEEGREGRKGMEKDGTIDWSLLSRRKSSLGRDDVVWRT